MPYQRGPYGGERLTMAFPPFTPMVRRILWCLGVVFALQTLLYFVSRDLLAYLLGIFALSPQLRLPGSAAPIAVWQLVTYAALHGGVWHLVFNGLGVWMFGGDVERVLGSRGFLRFFLVCVVGGGVAVVIGGFLTGAALPVVGASGGILGLVLAFAMFFPDRQVFIMPIPFPLPAWVMAAIYGLLNLYGALFPSGGPGGISYAAHLGGLAAGYLYLKGFIKPGSWSSVFRRRRRPFRVVGGSRDFTDIN